MGGHWTPGSTMTTMALTLISFTIQTYSVPAAHQEATDTETPDDPVPNQFEVADFLPDKDRLLAPLGNLVAVPNNDV